MRAIDGRFDKALQQQQFDSDFRYKTLIRDLPGVTYISMLDQLCPEGQCKHYDEHGWPILIDNSHMSLDTATEVIVSLKDKFEKVFKLNKI